MFDISMSFSRLKALLSGVMGVFLVTSCANKESDLGVFAESSSISAAPSPQLIYRPCDKYLADGYSLRCYFYRTHKKGGFYLPLVLIQRSTSETDNIPQHDIHGARDKRDLLVQIPGGPGQGFMTRGEEIDFWHAQMQEHHWDFDILLYDPRGTGDGKFAWRCEAFMAVSEALLARNISQEEEYTAMFDVLARCREDFMAHLKPRLRTASEVVHEATKPLSPLAVDDVMAELTTDVFSALAQRRDIAGMIDALGYDKVHLYGSSYGTRVALLAADIAQVKTLILDSVYRLEDGLFSQEPQRLAQVFELHEALYSQWPGSVGSFQSLYRQAQARLKAQALAFNVAHFQSGKHVRYVLTSGRLLDIAFSSLYRNDIYDAFYTGISEFVDSGEASDALTRVITSYVENAYDEKFSAMVFFSSECADNLQENDAVLAEAFARMPAFVDYFRLGVTYNACRLFPSSQRDVVQHKRVVDKPTLIFSGQYDPITPAKHAETLAASMPRARHMEIKNAGHGVLFGGYCDLSFIQAFIQSASLKTEIHCQGAALWP